MVRARRTLAYRPEILGAVITVGIMVPVPLFKAMALMMARIQLIKERKGTVLHQARFFCRIHPSRDSGVGPSTSSFSRSRRDTWLSSHNLIKRAPSCPYLGSPSQSRA